MRIRPLLLCKTFADPLLRAEILSLLRCVGCRLFEVAEAYHITRCTLHGAARLLDRALYAAEREAAPVRRTELQLLGVCCMLLAAKQREPSYPSVGKLCYITDNAYSPRDVRARERITAEALDFQIGRAMGPTVYDALRLVFPAVDTEGGWAEEPPTDRVRLEGMVNYLCDLSLADQRLSADRPVEVAEACVVLAAATLDVARPPLPLTPPLFDDTEIAVGACSSPSSRPAPPEGSPRRRPIATAAATSTEGGAAIGGAGAGHDRGRERRQQLMGKLHTLHRLAWARTRPDKAALVAADAALRAADAASRTDAVAEHYGRPQWERVAKVVAPITVRELAARLARAAVASAPPGVVVSNAAPGAVAAAAERRGHTFV